MWNITNHQEISCWFLYGDIDDAIFLELNNCSKLGKKEKLPKILMSTCEYDDPLLFLKVNKN